ncbi:hypothetical protein Pcinc_018985 [Petrolisthes cinctipes]|uniref:Uncharacterized protein n=1 Tax=Petrolisthes cinctipes TaxID=88211 RepID=A0AAE1FM43_PETCI|nr:hypothetical protein Pcinc_018985 [Petrolisthes cinctipes]
MTDTLGQPEVTETTTTYTVDYGPQTTTNGHPPPPPPRPGHDTPPSSSSRHSLASASTNQDPQLVSRKQTQHTTQQITTTTKVIREVQHIAPDGQVLDTYTLGEYPAPPPPPRPDPGYAMDPYRPHSPSSEAGSRGRYEGGYEYDPYSRGPPPPTLQDYPYEQQPYQPSQPNQPTQPGYSGRYRDPPEVCGDDGSLGRGIDDVLYDSEGEGNRAITLCLSSSSPLFTSRACSCHSLCSASPYATHPDSSITPPTLTLHHNAT